MSKGKKVYPKGCSDLGRAFEELERQEKEKRRAEYLGSRKEEVKEIKEEKK